jgi:hypothetical protein
MIDSLFVVNERLHPQATDCIFPSPAMLVQPTPRKARATFQQRTLSMRLAILPMWMILFSASPSHAEEKGMWIADNPYRTVQPLYDPCRDGRLSDGTPRTCAEIRRMYRHGRGGWSEQDHRLDACSNGRVSDGRPRTCRELLEWMEHR